MTFSEYVVKYCVIRGMSPKQAQDVLENMQAGNLALAYEDGSRNFKFWQEEIFTHSPKWMSVFDLLIKDSILKFIDKPTPT